MRHSVHAVPRRLLLLLLLQMPLLLAGCDQFGIESATALQARREAEGKAIGAGCRHAARSVEVCYGNNKKADKAAVFAGWREMNDYMRENKIEPVAPALTTQLANAGAKAADAADEEAAPKAAAARPAKAKAKAKAKGHDS